jgi:hypothetical protein
MSGDGLGSANGTVVGYGTDSTAVGADGSDDGGSGGAGGKSKLGNGTNGPDADPDAKKRTETGVWRLAAGAPMTTGSGDVPDANVKDTLADKVLSARDFSYDKTGLPRYLEANKAVFSAMSYDAPGRTDAYGSASGIITGSSFDEVVDWYRKNLPPGWHSSTISDLKRLGAVAQALSPEKIMQMLVAPNGAAPAKSVSDIPATAVAERMRLSLFSPPAGTKGDLGGMIVQHGDGTVTILMKTRVSPEKQTPAVKP